MTTMFAAAPETAVSQHVADWEACAAGLLQRGGRHRVLRRIDEERIATTVYYARRPVAERAIRQIREAVGASAANFLSPPCKGFSRPLPETRSLQKAASAASIAQKELIGP